MKPSATALLAAPSALRLEGSSAQVAPPSTSVPSAQAGSPASDSPVVSVSAGEASLILEDCDLLIASKHGRARVGLALGHSCRFVSSRQGSPQRYSTEAGLSFLVAASRPKYPDDPGSRDCDTRLRGVFVKGEAVSISTVVEKVSLCSTRQWDEKMFITLAERTQAVQLHP